MLGAQSSMTAQRCPKVLAVFPTSSELLLQSPVTGIDKRERFELRECGMLQVFGYERDRKEPSLMIDTGESYPPYLFHIGNVLAFQALGGASDHVYVFAFQNGKPKLVLRMATKEILHVSVEQAQHSVTILVPPVTYPNPTGKRGIAATPTKLVLPLQ